MISTYEKVEKDQNFIQLVFYQKKISVCESRNILLLNVIVAFRKCLKYFLNISFFSSNFVCRYVFTLA